MKIDYKNEKVLESILEHCGRRTGLDIIVTRCCGCLELLEVKLGHGVNGISDTYCPECFKKAFKNQHGNSAIWPLIGCLVAGGALCFEYIYAMIKYLG